MAFFNTSMPALGELQVRQALVAAVNPQDVRDGLGYPVIAAHGPLLQDQLGYDRTILQLPPNVETANQLLDAAGWVRSGNGPRMKNGTTLAISITAKSNSEYLYVTQKLQNAWKALGIEVDVQLLADEEIQNTLLNHEKYQVLVYGISMGIDPDIFPYWHSSQTARTNFSEYRSSIADVALESGRTRSDAGLRALKYRPFLEAWRNDAPALALYQPRFLYVTYGEVFGLAPRTINSSVDRYNNVENWMIRQELSTL
jgi:peptide/nickel transport system substrate-binding protein